MDEVKVGSGVVLGFGGTNARYGVGFEGDILHSYDIATPQRSDEFFGWMTRRILEAGDAGHEWMVAGFPGPVSIDGKLVGPLSNVPGLSEKQYNLLEELNKIDPEITKLFDSGFNLVAVNDGDLAAQAAASREDIGEYKYDKTAALILGTGVGAGIVTRDNSYSNVFRVDRTNPTEIGQILLSENPNDTYENSVSGTAIESNYGKDPRELSSEHPAWEKVGQAVGRLATILGLMNDVNLVVPCGGVGSGAYEKYSPHLLSFIENYIKHGNNTQTLFLPHIIPVPSKDAQKFELFGGEGIMRDYLTRDVKQAN